MFQAILMLILVTLGLAMLAALLNRRRCKICGGAGCYWCCWTGEE